MKKTAALLNKNSRTTTSLLLAFFLVFQSYSHTTNKIFNDTLGFNQYKGKVIDSKTKKALIFATLTVNKTNISTITNTQGEFLLKVPKKFEHQKVTISFLGYTSKVISLSDFKHEKTIIKLETRIEKLKEISIIFKDANSLIEEVLRRKSKNYFSENTIMTAFYRETIKKRRTYVSLSEAVVKIYKQPYASVKKDVVVLIKARKSVNYKKMDTLVLKLQGGPFNTLFLDVMKYPNLIFSEDILDHYNFTFEQSTKIDNRPIYVIRFKQKPFIREPLYYGKLYIDAQSLALTSASYKLNLSNKEKASRLFIVKKPRKADVFPIEATYHVDYRVKDGKWFYGYSRIQLGFKVDWHKKLFNSVYYTTMEMVITDWEKNTLKKTVRGKDRLKKTMIMEHEASGFSDPAFWGEFNVIEPEKPIESAIKKIKKQLKRTQ